MRYILCLTGHRFPLFRRPMRRHLGICLGTLVFASALGFFASPAVAQGRPSVSSGSYIIRATYDECLTRARQALESEGYPAGRGGEQYYWGGKGINWAIILCEPPGGSRFSFHIFVHGGNPDARVADAERDSLARRMGQPNPASSGNTGNTGNTGGGNARNIQWSWGTGVAGLNVSDKIGQRFTVRCPPNGIPTTVFGTDMYEGEGSSVCTAAVHKGLITVKDGGIVTIEISPGLPKYVGSTRNGVISGNLNAPGFATFVFVSQPADDVTRLFSGKRNKNAVGSLQQIAGLWRRDNGSVIRIMADGTGVFEEISADTASFGFKRGDTSLTGIRPANSEVLEASLMVRARRDECPSLAPTPVKASIKIGAEGDTLFLNATSKEHDGSCRWTDRDSGTINHTYTRVRSCSWVGQWRLNGFNAAVMTLKQSGENVTGEYPGWHNGRVTSGQVGQSDGRLTLTGTWENNYGGGDRGGYQITMSADCNSWNGKWNTANNSGTWSAVRLQ